MAEEKAAEEKVSVQTVFRDAPYEMPVAEREVLRSQGLLREPVGTQAPEKDAGTAAGTLPVPGAPDKTAKVPGNKDGAA